MCFAILEVHLVVLAHLFPLTVRLVSKSNHFTNLGSLAYLEEMDSFHNFLHCLGKYYILVGVIDKLYIVDIETDTAILLQVQDMPICKMEGTGI